ncbi:hypothetical protein [Streptomyces sp. NPDC057460]|uniref:hypothetical protein n=1 Tax=Streptomyces sp. NPDC057460 TaxID=3346141 RepID=UPI00369261FF
MKLLSKIFRGSKNPADAAMSQRLEESIESAGYWANRMPREAARLVQKVRLYTSTAAALSLITGLLAWPVIGESSRLTAQVLISVLSGLAALTIVAPHAIGLSDRGDESIKLCSTYGAMYRELLETKEQLATGSLKDPSQVADIICQFERIQERRDALALPAGEKHTDNAYALERIKGIGRRGWSVPGGLREIARPLLPSVRTRPQVVRTPTVDDEAVIAALIYVLKSGGAAQQVPPYSEAPPSTVHRPPLPVRPRTGNGGENSPGEVGSSSRPGSADPSRVVLDSTHVRATESAKPHIRPSHSGTGLPTL